jgi:RNA recognition motif-containing protein
MRIFIGSLSYKATAEEVLEIFSGCGFELTNLEICVHRDTGQSRGFAFAECEDHRVVEHMNNTDILGRRIVVNEARPREDRPKREREWKGAAQDGRYGRD